MHANVALDISTVAHAERGQRLFEWVLVEGRGRGAGFGSLSRGDFRKEAKNKN